jgi:hypothetical protein
MILTVSDLARLMQVSEPCIRAWTKQGLLPAPIRDLPGDRADRRGPGRPPGTRWRAIDLQNFLARLAGRPFESNLWAWARKLLRKPPSAAPQPWPHTARPDDRPEPRWLPIILTMQARVHILACRQAAGLQLWCERDLALPALRERRLREEEPLGKEPYSAAYQPTDSLPQQDGHQQRRQRREACRQSRQEQRRQQELEQEKQRREAAHREKEAI